VTVDARADAGAFYGTRSLLQLIKQAPTIPAGVGRDWPSKPERGLMVDNGRKYFSVGWLRNHVKDLAYLKLNYFHLHVSDNLGFRLESTTHPEVVSAQRYTKQEIDSIWDPRHAKTLWKAMQFDKLQKSATRAPTKTPAVVKPGASNPMTPQVKNDLSLRKAQKSASTSSDRAKVIQARLENSFR
jgi:N-acetyl-beta-hexosaminidase